MTSLASFFRPVRVRRAETFAWPSVSGSRGYTGMQTGTIARLISFVHGCLCFPFGIVTVKRCRERVTMCLFVHACMNHVVV